MTPELFKTIKQLKTTIFITKYFWKFSNVSFFFNLILFFIYEYHFQRGPLTINFVNWLTAIFLKINILVRYAELTTCKNKRKRNGDLFARATRWTRDQVFASLVRY